MVEALFTIIGCGVWGFLIAISLHPTWGAQFGMWIRGDSLDPYLEPTPVEVEEEEETKLEHSTRLDRWV